ncbi:LEA type 2 family protein [Neisseriaceae bacterium TC5R-5]|nr:LEA type 2 family protein [Neisseriaceae bacterium TC5R-5]
MRTLFTLLLLLLTSCSSLGYEKPRVSVTDIQPGKANLFEQNFNISLRITNPNKLALNAKGLAFDLAVAGELMAHGQSQQAIVLPAQGEAVVTVSLRTSLISWLQQVGKRMEQGGGPALEYQISGTLEGVNGLADVPFTSKGEWKLPS